LRVMVSVESPVFAWNEFKLDLIQGFVTTGISRYSGANGTNFAGWRAPASQT
jgi:hypothetical protein